MTNEPGITSAFESKSILKKKHDRFILEKIKELDELGIAIVFTEEQRDAVIENSQFKIKVIKMPPMIKLIKE